VGKHNRINSELTYNERGSAADVNAWPMFYRLSVRATRLNCVDSIIRNNDSN